MTTLHQRRRRRRRKLLIEVWSGGARVRGGGGGGGVEHFAVRVEHYNSLTTLIDHLKSLVLNQDRSNSGTYVTSIQEMVGKLRKSISQVDNKFVEELRGDKGRSIMKEGLGAIVSVYMNLIILVDISLGDGIKAWVTLDELLTYATLDPSPIAMSSLA
ncbi:hypothetical protein JHK85_018200 [Glycine max]|nr:hypothetical protein JHK85_018200 [Glycine max]